jgi:hypothetical protein
VISLAVDRARSTLIDQKIAASNGNGGVFHFILGFDSPAPCFTRARI